MLSGPAGRQAPFVAGDGLVTRVGRVHADPILPSLDVDVRVDAGDDAGAPSTTTVRVFGDAASGLRRVADHEPPDRELRLVYVGHRLSWPGQPSFVWAESAGIAASW